MIDVLAAEWWKIRTARSTWVSVATVPGIVALVSLIVWSATRAWDDLTPQEQAQSLGISSMPTFTSILVALPLAILGIVVVTSEYSTGMIRTTFTVMPRRRLVLVAKAIIVMGLALMCGLGSVFADHFLTSALIGDRTIPGAPASLGTDGWALLTAGCSVVMFALLGLGLAALTRSTIASIIMTVALWYIVPIIAINIPSPWSTRIGSVLPTALSDQLAAVPGRELTLLSPLLAGVAMLAYTTIPLGCALVMVTRRDA